MPPPRKVDTEKAGKPATKPRRAYLPAAERRKSIIAAAQEVFARSNLQGARTRDIAKAAAVNQATIFEHFASKEVLFQEAVVQPLLEVMRGMQDRVQGYEAAASRDELAALARQSSLRNLESMSDIFPLLTAALFSEPEQGKRLYCDHVVPLLQQRGASLSGLLREGIDPEFVGLANFGMIFAIAMDRYFKGESGDLAPLAAQLTMLSTGGFARTPGEDKPADHHNSGEDHVHEA